MKEQMQLFAEAQKTTLINDKVSDEKMEAIEILTDVEAFDVGFTDVAGYTGWNGATNSNNITGHYMISKDKLEAQELSRALTILKVMKYTDVVDSQGQHRTRTENTESWIFPVKISENIIIDKALETNWLMLEGNWQEKLPEFVTRVKDITSGFQRWVPNLDNTTPDNVSLPHRIFGMPESDDVSSEMEDTVREGGGKKQKNADGSATDTSSLAKTKEEWMYYIAKVALCAIEEIQNIPGNVVLTTEPMINNVAAMTKDTVLLIFRKYVQFIYSACGTRPPNDDENHANASFIITKPWAYMAKSDNIINNFIVLRNDREGIEQNLISTKDAEQRADFRRMREEASHADAGTGFLIKMKDFKDKFPEEILLAAIRSAEKSLHDKSVSNASGNRATKAQKNSSGQ